jgi:hypothetical protein
MTFQIIVIATFLLHAFFAPAWAETTRMWKTVSELSEAERADIDLRTDTPRDPQIPYLPAERYPFSPPYTAEEMGYRAMEFPHMPRWSAIFVDGFGSITSSGFLQQAKTAGGVLAVHADGLTGYLYATPPGGEYFRWLFQDTTPPESYGNQTLMVGYRTDRTVSTRLDSFFYSPSLRRREGKLVKIEVRTARLMRPELQERGYASFLTVYWDLDLDMMTYSFHDNFTLREWSEKDRQVLFRPDFMRRGWFLAPLKFLEEIRSPEEFYLRPHLDREKFPQDRRIEISGELEARIRAQEEAGHLVFLSAVQARAQ